MQRSFLLALGLAVWSGLHAIAAQVDEEQQLIQVLLSSASPADRDGACEKLKLIGTGRCVPALSALLLNDQLSHSARYVLEAMPLPEAGQALLSALDRTSGSTRLGIICSLGIRGETNAIASLRGFLSSPDEELAAAAARALGQIGPPEALRALQEAWRKSSGPVYDAVIDGLLRCANRLLVLGKPSEAFSIYQGIYDKEKIDAIRLAAYRGLVRARGNQGLSLVTRAIAGPPGPAQTAALQLVREVQGRRATEELAELLRGLKEPIQIALTGGLAQRGDPAALPALMRFASTCAAEVRIPVLKALGDLGDATVVPILSEMAAGGSPEEAAAARQALVDLRRGNIADALVLQLANARPEVQAELARALGERGDHGAVPKLLELAEKGSASARKSSLRALGLLADEPQLASLVQLVVSAQDGAVRSQATEALNYACQRILSKRGQVNVEALSQGIDLGSKEARIALLPVTSGLATSQTRTAIRSRLTDPDPQVSAAATRALCDSVDPELLEDVLTLARVTKDDTFRSLAIAGGVRLVIQEEAVKISKEQRIAALKSLLAAAVRPEQKRLVIAGLGEIPDYEGLRAIEPLLDDPALQAEAGLAAAKIAVTLPGAHVRDAESVLNKALAATTEEAVRQPLKATLKQLQDRADFLVDWMVAGPFRQAGKDYAALFDIVFPPEMEDPKGVEWKALPAGADAQRPYVMDLLKALGGEQCVAYARTWVRCDNEQPMLLELGSDDGVKVWLNDKQVYALNTARPLQPGSDKVTIRLHSGWNRLLLKVTQNNLGWEFCARLRKPDGSHAEGLQIDAAPK